MLKLFGIFIVLFFFNLLADSSRQNEKYDYRRNPRRLPRERRNWND